MHYFKSHQPTSKHIKLQSSRKIGCTTSVQIRKFVFYPEYSVDCQLSKSLTKKQERKVKEVALKQLRSMLSGIQEASTVQTTEKYFISLPTEEAHHQTHPTGASVALAQKVHPQVITKIHELVLSGVSESIEMKRHLKYVLCYKLFVQRQTSKS